MIVLNVVLHWLVDKYMYVVGLSVAVLALMEIFNICKEKKWIKFALLTAIFIPTVIVPLRDFFTIVTLEKEEFKTSKNNISYLKTDTGNIILKTAKEIDEPVDLRIKNRWIHLTYLTDYSIKNGREVMINYEFGNNDKDNKTVADVGLVFTYKARSKR